MKTLRDIFRPAAFVMAAALTFTACEVDTTTVMFEEDHNFSTPSDTVFSMLGILTQVQQVAERGILLGELRGDLVTADLEVTRGNQVLKDLADFTNLEDTTFNRYRDYYAVINNCNFYLDRADAEMERRGTKVFLKEYAAVSAYRAWAYLQLALLYKSVPFYTQPLLSYSDIEQVMNDVSNRKELDEICSYFIEDLKPYVDVPFPDYRSFTYISGYAVSSEHFFLPVRLLLGDLYLWRGSVTGAQADFLQAAQSYRDYLTLNGCEVRPSVSVVYKTADLLNSTITNGWSSIFYGSNMEILSLIPFASDAEYGRTNSLAYELYSFVGSEALRKLVDESYYCYVMYTEENPDEDSEIPSRYGGTIADETYYGTPDNPRYLSYISVPGEPQYFMGDLRFRNYVDGTYGTTLYIDKYSSLWPHVTTYRTGAVYLRLAEAANRAGYPLTAFHVLKYGLTRGNLVQFDANGELDRLMQSGSTFYDFGEDALNMGVHGRGCGNAEMDTLHYSLPEMASRIDSIRYVEDLICDEMALETAYEGNRFFDLMRFAFRRGEEYLADKVARRNSPDTPDASLQAKLKNRDNWYLPMVEN